MRGRTSWLGGGGCPSPLLSLTPSARCGPEKRLLGAGPRQGRCGDVFSADRLSKSSRFGIGNHPLPLQVLLVCGQRQDDVRADLQYVESLGVRIWVW